jgi:hypothetical protein
VLVNEVRSDLFPFGSGPITREDVKLFVPVIYTHAGRVHAISVFDDRL